MLNVFLTFDTEVWCGGWNELDRRFPEAFRRYVYGPTARGDGALPLILRVLNEHGLIGVFFVEPLFSKRFGIEPLREIVALIQDAGHEVQVHLHTEWADATDPPLIADLARKHQHLAMFDRAQQTQLIKLGIDQLRNAGANTLRAFRAGNYGMNEDTPAAVHGSGLEIDSSYNPASRFGGHFVEDGEIPRQAFAVDGVLEYPISVFQGGKGGAPHALQLTSCSFQEMRHALRQAFAAGWESVVIVAHNFELMNRAKTRIDPIALHRFENLCRFLNQHRDQYRCQGFNTLDAHAFKGIAKPLEGSAPLRFARMTEQVLRRAYGA
ncbi:MAG: polysaccharide deacetylase [Gammaproteobacteria bacterium]|nr:polysaccharide deacetylase [Gammaproteobacteria bacterium]MCP5137090.1 polysaccharide deacetylase [Gammaproteobacteria bacterium]